jgi:ribose transport system permease protein
LKKNSEKSKIMRKILSSNILILTIGFLIIITIFGFLSDRFLTLTNIKNVLRQVPAVAILSFGMTLVILTGNIDLSAGSGIAFSGVLIASLMQFHNFSILTSTIIIAVFLGTIYGFSSFLISTLQIPAFIVTLALTTILRGFSFIYSNRPIYVENPSLRNLGRNSTLGIPNATILMIIIFILLYIILEYTQFGRHIYAVGDNQEVARRFNINVKKVIFLVYFIHGITVVISSLIIAGRLSSGSPNAGEMMELDAIAAVVIGGTSFFGGEGSLFGTLIGAFLMAFINNGLNLSGVSSYNQMVVRGLVILSAVIINSLQRKLIKN